MTLEIVICRFTQKNVLRIYPKGTRFNSSNYKPLVGWMHGAQMVAFNMQVWVQYSFRSCSNISYRCCAANIMHIFFCLIGYDS